MDRRFVRSVLAALFLAGWSPVIWAQGNSALPLNTFVPPSSIPQHLTVVDDQVYFSADDGIHGRELWCTDGTPEGTYLVDDSRKGYKSSDPRDFRLCGGRLVFSAAPNSTRELMYVDLVADSARPRQVQMLKEINPSFDDGADPEFMGTAKAWTYFTAVSSLYGREVWRTDGTAEGTQLVMDIWPGPHSPSPGYELSSKRAVVGSTLYFLAYWRIANGVGEPLPGLWRTNGTAAETVCVGPVFEQSEHLCGFAGRLFFHSSDAQHGREPWVSDGTAEGTQLFADLNPGAADSWPSQFNVFGSRMVFQAKDSEHGTELWVTDGTPDGTGLLMDLNPGAAHSDPYGFSASAEGLFFSAETTNAGRELWFTDGTADGTRLVRDIWQGRGSSHPYGRCDVGGTLFFGANDGRYGEELWKSDGTPEGTKLVRDINPGAPFSEPHSFVNLNGILIFVAKDPVHGEELWRSDGTEAGTQLLLDVYSEPMVNPSSSPAQMTFVGDRLFFVANDIEHGAELWSAQPGNSLPSLVLDIFPGSASSSPEELTVSEGLLYFRADDGRSGSQLWRSDGTEGGTVCVHVIDNGPDGSAPGEIAPATGGVYFAATERRTGRELWWASPDGARLVCDIRPGSDSSMPHDLVVHGGVLYFAADDGAHGEELWISEGQLQTTKMVRDIVPLPFKGAALDALTVGPDGVYFTADDGYSGRELWRSDGTREGTRLWQDVRPVLPRPSDAATTK